MLCVFSLLVSVWPFLQEGSLRSTYGTSELQTSSLKCYRGDEMMGIRNGPKIVLGLCVCAFLCAGVCMVGDRDVWISLFPHLGDVHRCGICVSSVGEKSSTHFVGVWEKVQLTCYVRMQPVPVASAYFTYSRYISISTLHRASGTKMIPSPGINKVFWFWLYFWWDFACNIQLCGLQGGFFLCVCVNLCTVIILIFPGTCLIRVLSVHIHLYIIEY